MPPLSRRAVGLALIAASVVVAACSSGPTTPSCSYAWASPSQAVTAGGGSFQAMLTTTAACSWAATVDATWVTLDTAQGTGPGTVTFRVAANSDPSPRAAALTVQGQRLDIRQDPALAAQSCAFDVWPPSVSFGASGGAAPMAVTGPSGCRWTATTSDPWLTLAGESGTGAGPMIVSAAPNPGAMPRTGSIQVGSERVDVVQAGVGCDFDVSPTSRSVSAAGDRFDVAVDTSTGCDWQAVSSASWLTVSTSRAAGPGRVTVDAAALSGTTSRTGNLRIAGATVTVTQSSSTTTCAFVVAPQAFVAPAAGDSFIVNVTTSAGCTWTASSSASWVTIPRGQSGAGPGTIGVLVGANASTAPRTALLRVGAETVTISQSGAAPTCAFTVTPTSQAVPFTGGKFQVAVSTSAACQWRATASVPWLTITGATQGTGTGVVDYAVIANTMSVDRTGTLTIGGQTVTVLQATR